jgi:predicted restriction endonuclease
LGDERAAAAQRRRSPAWRTAVLQAWDRQCAFCGYDGQLGGASAGLDAAHVRWFTFDGPDDLDNGLALCALHHKLFDLGATMHEVPAGVAQLAERPSCKRQVTSSILVTGSTV